MAILSPTNFETVTYNMANWSSITNTNWQSLNTYMNMFNLVWDGSATNAIGIKYDTATGKWVASASGDAVQTNLDTHISDVANPHSVTQTQVGLDNVINLKMNLTATAIPTVTDDSSVGYNVGSRWVYADVEYVLVDSTVGAAVWEITTASGGSANSPLTTKGDIWGFSTVDARIPAGADGYVLSADSTQTLGVVWIAASGTGNMNTTTYDPAAIVEQLVGLTAIQTITNKTLTSPVINTPTGILSSDVGLGNVVNLDTSNASNITTGTLPSSVLPPIAITSVTVVASETDQLALVAEEGDVAVRSDIGQSFVKNSGTTGTITDWTELQTPTDAVLSVNGYTGTITLTTSDLAEGTNLYYTDTRVSANSAVALNTAKVTESTTVTSPLVLTGYDVSLPAASTTVSGYLTTTDWNTFNDKQPAGSYALSGTNSDITSLTGLTTALSVAQGGTGAVTLTGVVIGTGTTSFTVKANPTGAFVGETDTQVLTNKTLDDSTTYFENTTDNTKKVQVDLSGLTTGNTRVITIPDVSIELAGIAAAQTLTNKRNVSRVYSTTSLATLTPEKDTYDSFTLTAQAVALTIANPVTTVANDFDQIQIRIVDNGTAQTIAFGTDYVAGNNNSLPTTTTISVVMNLGFEYNAVLAKYVLLAMD